MSQPSFDSTELPALQPRTHCVLIARDPNFIYAYWNYSGEDINRARNGLMSKSGDPQLILRVYDITHIKFNGSNAHHTWDLDVGYSTRNWYVHVWQDNADYCAELGLRGGNCFFPLTRSNLVHTAPKTTSTRDDLIWQDIKSRKGSQPYIQEEIKGRYKGLMKQHSKKKFLQEKHVPKARTYYLTAQDIRAYYMKLFSSVSKNRISMADFQKGGLKNVSWQKVHPLMASPDVTGRAHPGSSMGFSENKGASENLHGLQAGASEGRLNKRKFFFEIWTELIVHGRTEPDATVSLNQQGITLNPDGTFSLRYALPDGEIPLKFIAQSADGVEQRHIYTRVERAKTIGFPKMLKDPHG